MQSYNSNSKIVFFLIVVLFFVILTYYIVEMSINCYEPQLLLVTIGGSLFSVCLFVFSKQTYIGLQKEYFRICTLFILGYLIVGFQKYIDVLVGYEDSHNSFLFVSPSLINKAALLTLSGLLGFFIGYLIYNPRIIVKPISICQEKNSIRILNYVLFVAVCLFVYYNGFDYLLGTYSQEYLESKQGTISAYSEVVVRSLIFAVLILYTKKGKGKKCSLFCFATSLGWFFHFSLFIYLVLVLISGDRGPIITIVSVYFFSYIIKERPKFKLLTIAIVLLVASLGITMLGIIRSIDNNASLGERVALAFSDEKLVNNRSIINSTTELATSVRCLHYAMDYVPNKHPFLYGSFQLKDLLAIIPASNSFTHYFMDNSIQYISSAYFITYIHQGKHYSYGDGSMAVADLYLSFGILGVVIGFFLFGMLIKRIEVVLFSYNCSEISFLYYSVAFAFVGLAIYISRATILMPLKYASFTYIILFIYQYFNRLYNKICVAKNM